MNELSNEALRPNKKLRYLLVIGLIAGIAWLLFSESPDQLAAANRAYLERLAGMVCKFRERHGHLPQSFEEAHLDSGERLPNRGDFYGRPLLYKCIGDSAFFFRARDVELCYFDCRKVSRAEFVEYVRAKEEADHGPEDASFILELYGF